MTARIGNATFNLSTVGGKFILERSFESSDGTKISFSIPVKNAKDATLSEIHKSTITEVIALLQSTLPQPVDLPAPKE